MRIFLLLEKDLVLVEDVLAQTIVINSAHIVVLRKCVVVAQVYEFALAHMECTDNVGFFVVDEATYWFGWLYFTHYMVVVCWYEEVYG